MAIITTTRGDMDESLLVKTQGLIDNDVERTESVEYCVMGCDGDAHRTGQPDADGVFCAKHVHRSVTMRLKRGIDIASIAGGLG